MESRKEHPGQQESQSKMGSQNRPNSLETPGHGGQGIDKAPGEETAQDNVDFKQEALQGKKVDRDPTQGQDEPLDNQNI
jgi:hypothetical protein